jgi:TRAP-type mannitol/chloroaromatic compound transport system permease small subunit
MLQKIERFYRRLNIYLGKFLALVFLLMTINVFYDVVSRYAFNSNSVALQEMEWHLFSIGILLGVSLSLIDEAHVRVDFLYDRFSVSAKAWINIIGTIFFLLPLALLVLFGSLDFVAGSYKIAEISENPGGLPYRYLIKGMIPVSFGILVFTSFGYVVQNINLLRGSQRKPTIQVRLGMEESK